MNYVKRSWIYSSVLHVISSNVSDIFFLSFCQTLALRLYSTANKTHSWCALGRKYNF
jgi:hypothetical protein